MKKQKQNIWNNNYLNVMFFGGLGAVCRYLIGTLFLGSSFLSITIINLIGISLMAITENFSENKKLKYHTGFLGGFTSFSSLFLLTYPLFGVLINIVLALLIYNGLKKFIKTDTL